MGEKKMNGGMHAGFLFLYDWLPGFEELPATDAKRLFLALIARQKDGTPLPEFSRSSTRALARMIEVTIKRRLGGKEGGEKNGAVAKAEGVPLTPTQPPMQGWGTAKHSIAEHSKAEQSIAEYSTAQQSKGAVRLPREGTGTADAISPTEGGGAAEREKKKNDEEALTAIAATVPLEGAMEAPLFTDSSFPTEEYMPGAADGACAETVKDALLADGSADAPSYAAETWEVDEEAAYALYGDLAVGRRIHPSWVTAFAEESKALLGERAKKTPPTGETRGADVGLDGGEGKPSAIAEKPNGEQATGGGVRTTDTAVWHTTSDGTGTADTAVWHIAPDEATPSAVEEVPDWKERFDTFWSVYPKKHGREEAECVFYNRIRDEAVYARLMDGLTAWCASEEWREKNGRFVPRAAVFLRDERFDMRPGAYGTKPPRAENSTFDIDDFFEAALARSYGDVH